MRLPTCSPPPSPPLRLGIVRDVLRSDTSPCYCQGDDCGSASQMRMRSSVPAPSPLWRRPVGSGGNFPRYKDPCIVFAKNVI